MNINQFNELMDNVKRTREVTDIPMFLFMYFRDYGYRLARGTNKFIVLDNPVWDEKYEEYLYYHFKYLPKENRYTCHLKPKEEYKKQM